MRWLPYGPGALWFEFAGEVGDAAFDRGRAIADELERNPPAGLVEFVMAFTTVLLEFDPAIQPAAETIAGALATRLEEAATRELPPKRVMEIPVHYDGPDLERVAALHQLDIEQVVALHTAPVYKVYMLGFSPGFPYLGDLDSRLHTPRLASPRVRVFPGAVAIGGEHTGIYTVETPGGWNIIGRTELKIFDAARAAKSGRDKDSFLLAQGDLVKFIPVSDAERRT